jgi:hypothetical protein
MAEASKRWTRRPLVARERLRVTYQRRPASEPLGRFGGGWQWSLGVDASRGLRTVIVNLLVCSVRISRGRRRR